MYCSAFLGIRRNPWTTCSWYAEQAPRKMQYEGNFVCETRSNTSGIVYSASPIRCTIQEGERSPRSTHLAGLRSPERSFTVRTVFQIVKFVLLGYVQSCCQGIWADKLSIFGKMAPRGLWLAFLNKEVRVQGRMIMTTYNPAITPYRFECFRDDLTVESLMDKSDEEDEAAPRTFSDYYK